MCMQKRDRDKRLILPERTEEQVIRDLRRSPVLYMQYQKLKDDWRQRFLDYCTGKS